MFCRISVVLLALVVATSGRTSYDSYEDGAEPLLEYLEELHDGMPPMSTSALGNRHLARDLMTVARYGKGGSSGGKKGYSGPYPYPGPAPTFPAPEPSPTAPGPGKGGKKGGPYPYSPSAPVFGKGGKKGSSPTSPGVCPCPKDPFELPFYQFPFETNVTISVGASDTLPGTVYLFNGPLYNQNSTTPLDENIIPGTYVTGVCHKINQFAVVGGLDIPGVGSCRFTYTLTLDTGVVVTFTVSGELADIVDPSILSIDGGTLDLAGAEGEVYFSPIYPSADSVDVFLEPLVYSVTAILLLDNVV